MASQTSTDASEQVTNNRSLDDLWGIALKILKPQDQTAIREISTSTDQLQKNRKGGIIIFKDGFAKIVNWIENLKSVGDIVIQFNPVHAALPWAAARLILRISD
ncbi:uncharacterized protein RAG0_05812 [Rhynchosporium agropyri]|uniref:NWD NACHT-NTPase N-terminal domain-containing protein n=1 Tax=Rhynchosporium agropyri TaxID=914238 RepID=A0A1E1KES9_9HELO|nr:uncharacterized protein RAG0_05812 [Rhynchosporium agropyri]